MSDPIQGTISQWKAHLKGQLDGGLDAILDEDCVFYSPVVFTPQRGREITKAYLNAAGATFDAPPPQRENTNGSKDEHAGKFRYTKEVLSGHTAVLEFETEMAGKYVNGVDIITCNDAGRIVEFRVMIRPLQAVNTVHGMMKAMLEKMNAASAS